MSQESFYYANEQNQPVGPFALTDLKKMLVAEVLDPGTQVRAEGDSEWTSLESLLPAPAPLPPTSAPPLRTKDDSDKVSPGVSESRPQRESKIAAIREVLSLGHAILGGLFVLCLVGLLIYYGLQDWWFYFGWVGLVAIAVMVMVCTKIVLWGVREEAGGIFWFTVLVALVTVSIKAPRISAQWLWQEYEVQMGGSDWVSHPKYGIHGRRGHPAF